MPRLDHLPTLDDVLAIAGGAFEHSPKIDLGKAAILHPLDQVWAELQLPVPPLRPFPATQTKGVIPGMSMGSVAARRARIVNCCERGLNFTKLHHR